MFLKSKFIKSSSNFSLLKKLYKNIFFILLYFFLPLTTQNVLSMEQDKTEIRSIIVGHLYPAMNHNPRIINKLFRKIKNLKPDYIFVLGDSKLSDPIVIKKWRRNFGDKVFFAPGNNEIFKGRIDMYSNSVGYTQKVIETNHVRILIANSNNDAKSLNDFIEESSKNKIKKPTFLMLHHRIWDDTLTSAKPYEHDKSYYLKEIYAVLNKYVDFIFAGNSKHQYFFDEKRPSGNQNMNNIYWVDRVGNISAYSIGTGIGRPKLGFVEVVSNTKYPAIVIPHHINTDYYLDPIPLDKQILSNASIPPAGEGNEDITIKNLNYDLRDKFLLTIYPFRRYIDRTFFFLTGSFLTYILFQIFFFKREYVKKKK
tara:strand:+ start:597 stop:1700 length:1104 start_codon:yes stop_codon:yes gene_type:complete